MNFRTVGKLTSVMLLAGAMIGPTNATAENNEKMTGLPLHPGLDFQQTVNSSVCGKPGTMNIYDVNSNDTSLAAYLAWYKQQLKDFHYVHKMWSDRPQEMFYSPDGSKGVSITGTRDGKDAFAVTYMKLSSNLTTHQEDAFDPSNSSCK